MTPDDDAPRAPSAWRSFGWPLALAVLLIGHSVLLVVAMIMSLATPGGFTAPSGYEEALAWDRLQAERRESDRLGWSLGIRPRPESALNGDRTIDFELLDADGTPIEDAELLLRAYHHSRAGQTIEAEPTPLGGGRYEATLAMRRAGLWRIDAVATRGDDRFRLESDYWLAEPAGDRR